MQQFEVSREDDIFERHPWGLVHTEFDRLVCFFQEETHHESSGYRRGVYTVPDDRGRTWSRKRPITEPCFYHGSRSDEPRRVVVSPELLDDGRLVAVTHEEYDDTGAGPELKSVDTSLWLSDDEADSWDGPREIGVEGDPCRVSSI